MTATSGTGPTWHVGTVVDSQPETATARRLVLDVPSWPGNRPGTRLDMRLTAEDGYRATRSYSLVSSGDTTRLALAVEEFPDGEVSPFLVRELRSGDRVELRGPIGGYFVWPVEGERDSPVQLVAGGSGVVPLYAMAAARARADGGPFRLLYSVRGPEFGFFDDELEGLVASGALTLDRVHTRRAPSGDVRPPGRLTRDELAALTLPPDSGAVVYCCGPTPFVETVGTWLLELGHPADRIRAERFGGV
ncbi:MAG: FAD-binding oxidoreductase [Lapillicoccus sp.]